MLLHFLFSDLNFIRDIIDSTVGKLLLGSRTQEVRSAHLEWYSFFNFFPEEGVVNQLSNLLFADLAELLLNFFTEGISLLLLPHPLVVLLDIEFLSVLLLFLGYRDSLIKEFMAVSYKI